LALAAKWLGLSDAAVFAVPLPISEASETVPSIECPKKDRRGFKPESFS
jgi:hypothetical protein